MVAQPGQGVPSQSTWRLTTGRPSTRRGGIRDPVREAKGWQLVAGRSSEAGFCCNVVRCPAHEELA
jgi:hypothetical protein